MNAPKLHQHSRAGPWLWRRESENCTGFDSIVCSLSGGLDSVVAVLITATHISVLEMRVGAHSRLTWRSNFSVATNLSRIADSS